MEPGITTGLVVQVMSNMRSRVILYVTQKSLWNKTGPLIGMQSTFCLAADWLTFIIILNTMC